MDYRFTSGNRCHRVVNQNTLVWISGVWQLPLATAVFCFSLQYAGLGNWLTRRNLLLLMIPPLIVFLIILTNGLHHQMWQSFQVDGALRATRGSAFWATLGYAVVLVLVNLIIFIWLFVRSPRHRWPVVLMIAGQVINRTFFILDGLGLSFGAYNPILVMFVLAFLIYAIALFRFRILDPIPLARVAVLEQMIEGMLVLDLQGRVVDLNSAPVK